MRDRSQAVAPVKTAATIDSRCPVRAVFIWFCLFCLLAVPGICGVDIDEWETFAPEDLALTDNPHEQGARAMYLFRRADVGQTRIVVHGAIKIFNEAGRDLANVELPEEVTGIRARTVRPDGTAVEISKDDIMRKIVTQKRGRRNEVKVFAFPDVEPGSILEYIYKTPPMAYLQLVFVWTMQKDVFCRESWVDFDEDLLKIYNRFIIDTFNQADIKAEHNRGRIRYSGVNIPATPDEDYPPPGSEGSAFFFMYLAFQDVKGSGSLDLGTREGKDRYVEMFWEQFGKETSEEYYDFIGGGKKARRLAETILAGDDRPVEPAQKIYDHVMANYRNKSFTTRSEEERIAEEVKGKRDKKNYSVRNVINNGYGYNDEITLFCVALLRGAGLEAFPVIACGRDDNFFRKPVLLNQFDEYLLALDLPEGRVYLDPATPYCPYGHVSWEKQGVTAMLFRPQGGHEFIQVPLMDSSSNRIKRTIDASFDGSTLHGRMKIQSEGNPDFNLKNWLDDESDEERREHVQNLLEDSFDGVELEAHDIQNLRDYKKPVVITAEFTVPEFTVRTRTRLMFKPVMFGREESAYFSAEKRKLPIFFDYPLEVEEQATFHLPEGYQVDQLPAPVQFTNDLGTYRLTLEQGDGTLVSRRQFMRKGAYFQPGHYPVIREFYAAARTGDDTTAVLKVEE